MILQALYRLAQDEGLVSDPDFAADRVDWILTVDASGQLVGPPVGTHPPSEGKSAKRGPARKLRLPRRQASRSGRRPPADFLADLPAYVFGLNLDPKRTLDQESLGFRAQNYLQPLRDCAIATGDVGLTALVHMLDSHHDGTRPVGLPADVQPGDVLAFRFVDDPGGMLMSDRPAVEAWWKRKRAQGTGAASQRCLVTGGTAPAALKHPKIDGLPGNTMGAALVSFNSSAFESYGWKVFENAQVSNQAAEACATALNRLISTHPVDPQNSAQTLPRRNIRLPGDTVVCYWSRESAQGSFLDCLAGLLEADEASVAELYRSVWRGRPVELDPAPFYALTISVAQGRAVVRGWLETTLEEVGRHLARHFQDFKLDSAKKGEHPPAIPLARLLAALGVRGDKEKTPPSLSVEIFQAALRGTLYPLGALQRAIERTRMEPKHDEPGKNGPKYTELLESRTAIIKACINRRWRIHAAPTDRKELDASMDPTCSSPGYQLGLLMAVLERLQQAALGDNVNATLIDRFFAGASASPRAVFMRLLKTSVFHARKAADESKSPGFAFRLERLKEAILDRFSPLSGGIPTSLDLENQGLFILGYYQMRRWLWLGADERRTWEAEHPSAPGAFVWAKAGNGPEQNSDIQQGDTHAQ